MKGSPLQHAMPLLAAAFLSLLIAAVGRAGGDAAEGKRTYDVLCYVCHGFTGAGDGPAGAALDPPPRNFTSGEFKFDGNKDGVVGSDEDLRIVIRKGGAAFGGSPIMVPWSHLSEAEVTNLIAYIRSLAPDRSASP